MRPFLSLNLSLSAVLFLAAGTALGAEEVDLQVGDPAPHFQAKADNGETWNSKQHFGEKTVVLYFYPADMTGGCTAQACGYRDALGELSSQNVEVVGVSGDTVENHQKFKEAYNLNFTLLADPKGKVAKKFGVPVSVGEQTVRTTVDGTEYELTRGATARRWTFVIGPDGKIVYKDDSVNARQDPQQIAEVVEQLPSTTK